jgi:hypothetical protein
MRLFTALTLVTLAACTLGPASPAHEIDEGLELGATLAIQSASPVLATVTLVPTVAFKSAVVETPNTTGGAQIACRFGTLVLGQRYTCTVTGNVADDDSGLVIAISGVRSVAVPGHDDRAFKAFTIPNPKFDAAAVRAAKQAKMKPRTTLDSREGASVR